MFAEGFCGVEALLVDILGQRSSWHRSLIWRWLTSGVKVIVCSGASVLSSYVETWVTSVNLESWSCNICIQAVARALLWRGSEENRH